MPEVKKPEIGVEKFHEKLEKDIETLSAELRTLPTEKQAEKEALKSLLKVKIYGGSDQNTPISKKTDQPEDSIAVLPKYMETAPETLKLEVEKLLDIVWHKGIPTAVKEARKTTPLVIDAFHDALTDRLYEEFKKRKIIK
ncbi:MAG: hypothetical protein AAB885_02965 [Patescibacteria group bacterium]